MLKHNLLLIYRNFKRFKSTFFINLIGLSTGLACALLIYLWVSDELQVDQFHEKRDRLYQVMEHRVQGDEINTFTSTYGLLGKALSEEMPEVEYAASFSWEHHFTFSVGEKNIRSSGRFADADFFKIFTYPLIHGAPGHVLTGKSNIVISENLALSLFGTTDNVIGRTIEADHHEEYQVSGIYKSIPENATLRFDFVMTYSKFLETRPWFEHIDNTAPETCILLKPGVDEHAFNEKIADYIKKKSNNQVTHRTMFIKPYSEKYLYGKYENGALVGGRVTYVKLFSLIAVFILVIACINFMNLSTAKASRRIKEVGIKKAVGASRRELLIQYVGESVFMTFLSLLLAILMVDLALPQFNDITGKQLDLTVTPGLLAATITIALVTGLLAGSYPAIYLSGFNTASVLKNMLNTSPGEQWARKGLVVFQFSLSVIFIVAVIVVYRQIAFVQAMNLGYSRDGIITFDRDGSLWDQQRLETFINEAEKLPGVLHASSITHNMTGHNSGTYGVEWPGKNPDDRTEFENVAVNYGMIETLGIELVEGRTFSPAFSADSAKIIFNEAAIDYMGLKDPIGKVIKLWGYNMEIIGVAKNFHFQSLHEKVNPLFFRLNPGHTYIMAIKLDQQALQETLAGLESLYKRINPGFLFNFKFLDEAYQAQYAAEHRVAMLSKYFAGLAVLISCLGLFGLAAFTAERRSKEIGIRKVLGASEFGIIYLLSTDFTKIVGVSIIVALPLSYIITRSWLAGFAFKISLEWWYFAGAGAAAVAIAWLTVGTQAFRAARVSPAECLKDE